MNHLKNSWHGRLARVFLKENMGEAPMPRKISPLLCVLCVSAVNPLSFVVSGIAAGTMDSAMSQLAYHPALVQIEETLDVVGQRYRVHQMIRGALLFALTALPLTLACALVAHALPPGSWGLYVIGPAWGLLVGLLVVMWVIRPLSLKPRSRQIARLIESRVSGLHNGFTNSLLLVERSDLLDNPWLTPILDEIATTSQLASPEAAVTFNDVRRLSWQTAGVVVPLVLVGLLFSNTFGHGFRQMLSPGAFVPAQGAARILSVLPGDATLMQGQPMDIVITAAAPADATARVILNTTQNPIELTGAAADEGTLRYACHLDHVDTTMQYRVEVAGTQSRWFTATVVQQINWTGLSLRITPPAYLKADPAERIVELKPADVGKTALLVPQGSEVALSMAIDVPVASAMLQVGDAAPVAMDRADSGRRFTGKFIAMKETTAAVLLAQTDGQIIARLPDPAVAIGVKIDDPPTLQVKWPTSGAVVAPNAPLEVKAVAKDDIGLDKVRVLMAATSDSPLALAYESPVAGGATSFDLNHALDLKPDLRKDGSSIRVQLEVTDGRNLIGLMDSGGGPQTTQSPIYEIKFRDPQKLAADEKASTDRLRAILQELLRKQNALHASTATLKETDLPGMATIATGQTELQRTMKTTADTFAFNPEDTIAKKTLLILSEGPAQRAIDLAAAYPTELVIQQRTQLNRDLQTQQRRIIQTLESLLALLDAPQPPATQPASKEGGDLPNQADAFKKLDDALKELMKEERRILDQTAALAKKPVDNFDDKDKKLLDDLLMSQEKLDAFMQQTLSDFSKLAEQDMSNASLLKELMEVYSEVTMAKDGLKQKATEIAVPAEEAGLELAKEISSNLEKWLADAPDRQKWTQEELLTKQDVPMAELPTELDDMIGELMEQQEDLFDEMEDMNANMSDSLDKGAGWDAMDGPIANMSAKGVTGNVLPNNNEMGGRSGEGRSGKSQGEFVEETATGKGGRNTPTRLDPTAFQQGQVKDTSKDPVGGATGGGKLSGQGGEGLEGPVPPGNLPELKRLAQKQAQLRNTAERLNLQYHLGRYDNFNLTRATALMRRVEVDLNANRYNTALRRRDVLLDSLDTSHLLLSGEISVQHDTTPHVTQPLQDQINDVTKGDLPAAWSDALKMYYEQLGAE
jgi:hypothetical protein